MDASAIVAIVAVSFTTIGAAGTGLWFIAKLSTAIDRLNATVDRLADRLDSHDEKLDHHRDRLTKLEASHGR